MKVRIAVSLISTDWMEGVASRAVLDSAFAWLCKRRIDYADSADVWNVRRRWAEIKPQLRRDLLEGHYRFQPLRRIRTAEGDLIELWAALDALVLKALAIVLNRRLDFPKSCYHLPGKAHRPLVSVVRVFNEAHRPLVSVVRVFNEAHRPFVSVVRAIK